MRGIVQMERPVFQLPYLINGSGYSIEESTTYKKNICLLRRAGYGRIYKCIGCAIKLFLTGLVLLFISLL